jgi:hypothetical protein
MLRIWLTMSENKHITLDQGDVQCNHGVMGHAKGSKHDLFRVGLFYVAVLDNLPVSSFFTSSIYYPLRPKI